MTLEWPCKILTPQHRPVDPVYRSTSGGTAINGYSQVVASDAGAWKASFKNVIVRTPQQITVWRGIAAQLQGRLGSVLIEVVDAGRHPLPPGFTPNAPLPFDNGMFFDNGGGFLIDDNELLMASLRVDAPVRATALTIDTKQVTFAPGYRFSIGERLYEIRSVEWQNAGGGKVKIWPPLREAVTAGSDCEFYKPKMRVRLLTDQEMELPLEFSRWGLPTVNFIEDI